MYDSLRRRVFIKQLRWDCWFTVVTAPPQGGRHMSATNCTWTAAEVFGDKGGEVVSSWKDASRYEKTVTANQSHGTHTHTQAKVSWITFSHLQSGQNRRWSKGWRYSLYLWPGDNSVYFSELAPDLWLEKWSESKCWTVCSGYFRFNIDSKLQKVQMTFLSWLTFQSG